MEAILAPAGRPPTVTRQRRLEPSVGTGEPMPRETSRTEPPVMVTAPALVPEPAPMSGAPVPPVATTVPPVIATVPASPYSPPPMPAALAPPVAVTVPPEIAMLPPLP